MTDFKKVAVTITDIEGAEHRIVGWQYGGHPGNPILSYDDDNFGEGCWLLEADASVPHEVILTLPTGIGAVVEIVYGPPINDYDRWVRIDANTWSSPQGHFKSDANLFDGKDFTVLAEGVEL